MDLSLPIASAVETKPIVKVAKEAIFGMTESADHAKVSTNLVNTALPRMSL